MMAMRNEIYISVHQTRSKELDITSIMRIPYKNKVGGWYKRTREMINEIKNEYTNNRRFHHNIIIAPYLLLDSHML